MKKKEEQHTEDFKNDANQHSMVCSESLFYTSLRAAAEDTEIEEIFEKK